jgi:hypothetical protein
MTFCEFINYELRMPWQSARQTIRRTITIPGREVNLLARAEAVMAEDILSRGEDAIDSKKNHSR